MRTIEAQRGWSGSKVRKVNKSVETSIVGSNTLNRKNLSSANILEVKTTEGLPKSMVRRAELKIFQYVFY